jgi:hypothetical protein
MSITIVEGVEVVEGVEEVYFLGPMVTILNFCKQNFRTSLLIRDVKRTFHRLASGFVPSLL